jgi:hypothetical protein
VHGVIVAGGTVSAATYRLASRGVRMLDPEGISEEDLTRDPS